MSNLSLTQEKRKVIKILKEALIIGGLVLVFAVGYWLLNPGKKRMLAKARKLHKKGELYYNEGDLELANEYYAEAESLRRAAREMA
ncbi:hypothetical protein D6777_03505 [Candidatus Woesearchaeota archaeon]|nr:MAG: hypothetical protein D6777_03505 [Candidatus Woesearchaeota archaeon]